MSFTWFWYYETKPSGLPFWLIVGPGPEGLGHRVMRLLSMHRSIRDSSAPTGVGPPASVSFEYLESYLGEGPDGSWKPSEAQLSENLHDLRICGAIEPDGGDRWQITDAAQTLMLTAYDIRGSTMERIDATR